MFHLPQFNIHKIIGAEKGRVGWISQVQDPFMMAMLIGIGRAFCDLKRESRSEIPSKYPNYTTDVLCCPPRDELGS